MSDFLEPVRLFTPAKINLFLNVKRKRSDGYHELSTVMCSVSLYDSLVFCFRKGLLITVTCDHPFVPEYRLNIVDKAARLFFKELSSIGVSNELSVRIHIDKKIPVGSGFGGGSSNAAFTLLLLNVKFGCPFSKKHLMMMARKIGADVPFFVHGGGLVFADGIGDQFRTLTCAVPKFALLVYTGVALSTSWVYGKLSLNRKLRLTKGEKGLSKFHPDVGVFSYRHHLFNTLESVSEFNFPVISEAKLTLLRLGALGVLMSGSGSGVFGLFNSGKEVLAAQVALMRCRCCKDWIVSSVRLLL